MQGAENVWRYDVDKNRTKTIQPLPKQGDEEFRFNWNAPILVSPHDPAVIYHASNHLLRSRDRGDRPLDRA